MSGSGAAKYGMEHDLSMTSMTPTQARAYLKRWAIVNQFEIEELRRTPMELKLQQLSALMASRHLFAADSTREKGVRQVRMRWAKLRKALGGLPFEHAAIERS